MNINGKQVEQVASAVIQVVSGLASLATMFLASQQQQPSPSNIIDMTNRRE